MDHALTRSLARYRIGFPPDLPRRVLAVLRVWLPVAGAALYLVLWTVAEAGRSPLAPKEVMFALWAIVIALAGPLPRVALAGTVAVPILVLLGGVVAQPFAGVQFFDGRPDSYHLYLLPVLDWVFSLSTSWAAWFAVPVVVGYVAMGADTWRRRVAALVTGAVSAVGYAAVLGAGGWLSWIGASGSGSAGLLADAVLLVLALLAAVIVAWLFGIGLGAIGRAEIASGRLETTAAQLDQTDLELRLAHDRGRISRDLHDSLAHALAIIVAQAEGAAAIHALKPEAAPESLGNIATVARHALGEVRRLVERINDDEDLSEHTSRVDHIPALVEEVGSAGLDASLRVLGTVGPLALSKQVAVYRIVQESLTNALKHGGRGSTATVTLDAQGAGLAVLVVSKSGGGAPLIAAGAAGMGRGIGIAGMKERARLVGGWLTAVPSDDDTFVVTGFIPPDEPAEPVDPSDPSEPRIEGGTGGGASDDIIDAELVSGALAVEGVRRG